VQAARKVTRGAFIALGASIPVSVALDNVLTGVIVLSWLAAGRFHETARAVRANPVALFACAWFFVHLLGALYSIGELRDIAGAVRKAAMFLLIPIAVAIMHDPRDRQRAFWAFIAAIALTAVLATLRAAELVPRETPLLLIPDLSPTVVFKYHQTQSQLLAFGGFACAVFAQLYARGPIRYMLNGCAALAVVHVFFLGYGRTGQLVLFLLIPYFGLWRAGRRGLVAGFFLAVAIAGAAYALPQSALHQRASQAASEAAEWEKEADSSTSIGHRLEYYKTTLGIIARHPLLGVGTGGFATAYEKEASAASIATTRNPHNEYLLKTAELGLAGLALMLGLLWTGWRSAARLARTEDIALARGLLITFAAASLVTSTLSDHTEGMLFTWASGVLFAGLRPERP
jgi:O-antigen ligase